MTRKQHTRTTVLTAIGIGTFLLTWVSPALVVVGAVAWVAAAFVLAGKDDPDLHDPDSARYGRRGAVVLRAVGVLALVGAGPLLAYAALGPEDGNPVGLGLLFVATMPFIALGTLLGLALHLAARPG